MITLYNKLNDIYQSKKRLCLTLIFIIYITFCIVLFFNFPVCYAPDSAGYIDNAKLLAAGKSLEGYFSYRGLGLPFILSLGFRIFGIGHSGIKVALLGLFIAYCVSLFVIACCSDFFADIISFIKFAVLCICLVINPVIITYSHMCLTEFPVIAVVAVFYASVLFCHKKNIPYFIRYIITAVCCALCYSIKQVSFPIPLIIFCAGEVYRIISERKFKPVANIIICAFLSLAVTFGYIKWQGNILAEAGGSSIEGSSVSSFAGSFIVDGLRYFNPSDRFNFEDEIDIYVMDDLYETKLDTIHTSMGSSLSGNLKYWLKCFKTSPERVFTGYKNNYAVICGVHNTIVTDPLNRAHTRVTITKMFFNGQENEAWVSYMCTGTPEQFMERINTPVLDTIDTFDSNQYLSSFLTKLVYMNPNNRFAFFQYSFMSYYAIIIALLSGLVIILKKSSHIKLNIKNIFISSLSTFVYIAFMAVTAQNIDRYGITTYLLCGMIMINIIAAVIESLKKTFLK